MNYAAVEYLNNPAAQTALNGAAVYRKLEVTLLKLPGMEDIGNEFPTYVKDDHGIRHESNNIVSEHDIIARNPEPIGKDKNGNDVFNEWLIPSETVRKNYGNDVISQLIEAKDFAPYRKIETVKAVLLTQELVATLSGEPKADQLHIKVSWSKDPMIAKVGDYITDQGYSISKHDMQAYGIVQPAVQKEKVKSNGYDSHRLG